MEQFYTKLSQISFYQLHPSYLPFIGTDYEAYRILHIGESHYCSTMDVEQFNIHYFSKWFETPCQEVETDLLHNNNHAGAAPAQIGMKTEAAKFPVFLYNVFERGTLQSTVGGVARNSPVAKAV